MLRTAENLLGPYVWGQYDLLILPPSFPYGGMENPCLTFVTPTILVEYIIPCTHAQAYPLKVNSTISRSTTSRIWLYRNDMLGPRDPPFPIFFLTRWAVGVTTRTRTFIVLEFCSTAQTC